LTFNSFNSPGLVKVLKFLQTHNTEYLSGQDLSDVLRISRVAIWKHIKKIQDLGYTVESKTRIQINRKFRHIISMGSYIRAQNKTNRTKSILF